MAILGTPEQRLCFLQWHWGSAYVIELTDGWKATRRDDGSEFTAESAEELRDAILADYTGRPVPRFRQMSGT
jgi:hypothetical protein